MNLSLAKNIVLVLETGVREYWSAGVLFCVFAGLHPACESSGLLARSQ